MVIMSRACQCKEDGFANKGKNGNSELSRIIVGFGTAGVADVVDVVVGGGGGVDGVDGVGVGDGDEGDGGDGGGGDGDGGDGGVAAQISHITGHVCFAFLPK